MKTVGFNVLADPKLLRNYTPCGQRNSGRSQKRLLDYGDGKGQYALTP